MADQGTSQWRGLGEAGFTRVQPNGIASGSGAEGSLSLTSDGPVKTAQGNTEVRVAHPQVLANFAVPASIAGSSVARTTTPRTLTNFAVPASIAGSSVARTTTPRTMRITYKGPEVGVSTEQYTLIRPVR